MKKIIPALLVVIAAWPTPSQAEADPASSVVLLGKCRDVITILDNPTAPDIMGNRDTNASFCTGFVAGFVNTHYVLEGSGVIPPLYCLPDGATREQAIRVWVRYLEDHPHELHFNGATTLIGALAEAFPCART